MQNLKCHFRFICANIPCCYLIFLHTSPKMRFGILKQTKRNANIKHGLNANCILFFSRYNLSINIICTKSTNK